MYTIRVLFLLCLLTVGNCRRSVNIPGPASDDGFSKCNSGGERSEEYPHSLGNMKDYNWTYADIDHLTTVIAHFRTMTIETKAVKNAAVKFMLLYDYVKRGDHKEFSGTVGYDAVCGWASQLTRITVRVRFFNSGNIKLLNDLRAGSWGAVSCAYVTSGINKIQVIN